jgi:hypothetical protein
MPGYPVQKPQIKHLPIVADRPPVKGGKVRPVRIRNGNFTRKGVYIEK